VHGARQGGADRASAHYDEVEVHEVIMALSVPDVAN
jgi:hypothetical protein